jgi:phage terminase large subunit-like protein
MTLQLAGRLGSQTPRIESVPPHVTSGGEEAADLAQRAGLTLDPWQRHVLDRALGQHADGRWAAPEVALVVPRQNGKGAVLEAIELYALFVLGEQVVHTAHLMSTSRKAHNRLWALIKNTPHLHRQVRQRRTSNEDQSIELFSGAKIEFVARSQGSARGWTEDRIVLDEAFDVSDDHMGALMPTLITRPNWQVIYASSAGLAQSAVLRRIRDRGVAADPQLAYFEWSVEPGADPDDEDGWAQANPALGIRIMRESIELLARSMEAADFGREILGLWDDPSGSTVIDLLLWSQLGERDPTAPQAQITGPVVFALDAPPERTSAVIAVAGHRDDGRVQVELADYGAGLGWVVDAAVELQEANLAPAWLLDPAGPAASLLPALREAGIEPVLPTLREMAQAAGAFYDDATAEDGDRLAHLGDPLLQAALKAARKRDVGDGGWTWARRGAAGNIAPLVAVTLAHHGLATHGVPAASPAPPLLVPTDRHARQMTHTADLARVGF